VKKAEHLSHQAIKLPWSNRRTVCQGKSSEKRLARQASKKMENVNYPKRFRGRIGENSRKVESGFVKDRCQERVCKKPRPGKKKSEREKASTLWGIRGGLLLRGGENEEGELKAPQTVRKEMGDQRKLKGDTDPVEFVSRRAPEPGIRGR